MIYFFLVCLFFAFLYYFWFLFISFCWFDFISFLLFFAFVIDHCVPNVFLENILKGDPVLVRDALVQATLSKVFSLLTP